MGKAGEDAITPLHDAVDAEQVSVVAMIQRMMATYPDIFPAWPTLLTLQTKSGQTAWDLAKSPEMRSVLKGQTFPSRPRLGKEICLDEERKMAFLAVLRKYCAEFSLHYVTDFLKLRQNPKRKPKFNAILKPVKMNHMVTYTFFRSDPTCATDLRTFNQLQEIKNEAIRDVVVVLSTKK